MIAAKTRYTLLMASLPPFAADLFAYQHPPISAYQLKKRLAWLAPEHAADLHNIQRVLYWTELAADSDADFLQHAQTMIGTIDCATLKTILEWRLQLRTLVAAIRTKYHRSGHKMDQEMLSMTPFARDIVQNWHRADFGLGARFPWLSTVDDLLQQAHYLELEKLLLRLIWDYYVQQSQGHYFDFEAVGIYVLRWDIVNRWTQYDGQKARLQFEALLTQQIEESV